MGKISSLKTLVLLGMVLLTGALAPVLAQGRTTLTFMRFDAAVHNAYLDPIIAAFEKANPEIKIESVGVATGGYEGMAEKALLSAASGQPYDLVQTGYSLLRTMVESGGVLQLDKTLAADKEFNRANMFPVMMKLGQLDGKQFMVPLGTSTPVLYFNRDAFRKAGLPDRAPRTWDELYEFARKLKGAGFDGVLWGWSITGNWIFQTMLENAGGAMGSKDGRNVAFNQTGGLAALEHYQKLIKEGLMPVTEDLVSSFASGKLGILIESSFQRVNLAKNAPFRFGVAPIPTPRGGVPVVPAGGNGVIIMSKDAAKQQAAWRFLRFLTEAEPARIVAEQTGYTPGNMAVWSEMKKKYSADNNYQVILNQVTRVSPWYNWAGNKGPQISKVIKDMQQAVLLGRMEPKAAADAAAKEVQGLLGR